MVTVEMVQALFDAGEGRQETQEPVAHVTLDEGSTNIGVAYGASGVWLGAFGYRPYDPRLEATAFLFIS